MPLCTCSPTSILHCTSPVACCAACTLSPLPAAMADTSGQNSPALDYHSVKPMGKLKVVATKPCATQADLSLAYSPGVAEPCLEIAKDEEASYRFTGRGCVIVRWFAKPHLGCDRLVSPPEQEPCGSGVQRNCCAGSWRHWGSGWQACHGEWCMGASFWAARGSLVMRNLKPAKYACPRPCHALPSTGRQGNSLQALCGSGLL